MLPPTLGNQEEPRGGGGPDIVRRNGERRGKGRWKRLLCGMSDLLELLEGVVKMVGWMDVVGFVIFIWECWRS
jgi:hypothetical protein